MRAGSAAGCPGELDERQRIACPIAAKQSTDDDAAEHQEVRAVP
jgi:hypothetical protein